MRPMMHAAAALFSPNPVRGVEVGVQCGVNAQATLEGWPYGYDGRIDCALTDRAIHMTLVEINANLSKTIYALLAAPKPYRAAFQVDRSFNLIIGDSKEVAKQFPDGAFDFVYIDDDHSHASCMASLTAWSPKVKRGGLLGGHDFTTFEGVRTAVKMFRDQTPGLGPLMLSEWDFWWVKP